MLPSLSLLDFSRVCVPDNTVSHNIKCSCCDSSLTSNLHVAAVEVVQAVTKVTRLFTLRSSGCEGGVGRGSEIGRATIETFGVCRTEVQEALDTPASLA